MNQSYSASGHTAGLRAVTTRWLWAIAICALLGSGCEQKAGDASAPPAPAKSTAAAPSDVLGQTIRFGQGGNSEPLRTSGWGDTEKDFTWTLGNNATLSLPVPSATGGVALRFKMSGMVNPPSFPAQPVELVANGQKVADWQVGALTDYQIAVPADVVKAGNGTLKLELRTPKPMSPKSVNQGNDERVLGVCVWELQVTAGP